MNLILLLLLVVILGVGSCIGALRSSGGVPSSRRAKIRLVVAIVIALYLSLGLVYRSDTLRWYGAPLPVGAFERVPGGDWVDYVGPLGILAAGPNFVFWIGLALTPESIPFWYKRFAAVGWSKTIRVAALVVVVGVVALYAAPAVQEALAPSHVVVVRNQTSQTLSGIDVACNDGTTHYANTVLPGEERVLNCDGPFSKPLISQRGVTLGVCDAVVGKRERFVITLSGSDGHVVQCERSTP